MVHKNPYKIYFPSKISKNLINFQFPAMIWSNICNFQNGAGNEFDMWFRYLSFIDLFIRSLILHFLTSFFLGTFGFIVLKASLNSVVLVTHFLLRWNKYIVRLDHLAGNVWRGRGRGQGGGPFYFFRGTEISGPIYLPFVFPQPLKSIKIIRIP